MKSNRPDDLRQAIEERDGAPVYFVNSPANAIYVLMRADRYDGKSLKSVCRGRSGDTRAFGYTILNYRPGRHMARLARIVAPGLPHHITQRGNRRQPTFSCDEDYQYDLELMVQ
jgi:hypothetical protein